MAHGHRHWNQIERLWVNCIVHTLAVLDTCGAGTACKLDSTFKAAASRWRQRLRRRTRRRWWQALLLRRLLHLNRPLHQLPPLQTPLTGTVDTKAAEEDGQPKKNACA